MFEKFLKRLDPKDVQLKSKYQIILMMCKACSMSNIISKLFFSPKSIAVQAVPSSQMDLRMQRKKTKIRSGSSAEKYS